MNRNEFLKVCGGACLGLVGISVAMQSCATQNLIEGNLKDNLLQISKSDFIRVNKDDKKIKYRKYILVHTSKVENPIVVYRENDTTYTALLLSCTHQGNQLDVSGDILSCSAHGSEFDNQGNVIQGPADQKLTSYLVTSDEKSIFIQLT